MITISLLLSNLFIFYHGHLQSMLSWLYTLQHVSQSNTSTDSPLFLFKIVWWLIGTWWICLVASPKLCYAFLYIFYFTPVRAWYCIFIGITNQHPHRIDQKKNLSCPFFIYMTIIIICRLKKFDTIRVSFFTCLRQATKKHAYLSLLTSHLLLVAFTLLNKQHILYCLS